MKLALNTLMWAGKPFAEVLGHARRLGILRLDLGALPGIGHLGLPAGDQLRARCTDLIRRLPPGGAFAAITADHPAISSSDEKQRRAAVAYTTEALQAAQILGAPVVGTSLGSIGDGRTWEQAAECAIETLREALDAGPPHVRLAVEVHVNDVCNSLDKAEHVLAAVGDARLGVCFDTSLLFWNRIDVDEAFERLGSRLFHVHLRGATRSTYFAIPGRDDIDFAAFFRQLQAIRYSGGLSLELYEVEERHATSTCQGVAEALGYLRRFIPDTG